MAKSFVDFKALFPSVVSLYDWSINSQDLFSYVNIVNVFFIVSLVCRCAHDAQIIYDLATATITNNTATSVEMNQCSSVRCRDVLVLYASFTS